MCYTIYGLFLLVLLAVGLHWRQLYVLLLGYRSGALQIGARQPLLHLQRVLSHRTGQAAADGQAVNAGLRLHEMGGHPIVRREQAWNNETKAWGVDVSTV